jgi:hypothetical protein
MCRSARCFAPSTRPQAPPQRSALIPYPTPPYPAPFQANRPAPLVARPVELRLRPTMKQED